MSRGRTRRVARSNSVHEDSFWRQIVESGIPLPVRQFEFAKCIGRKYRADLAWPDERVLIEVDGGLYNGGRHSNGVGRENDMERDAISCALGWKLMRFSPRHVRSGWALAMTKVALGLQDMTREMTRAKEWR